MSDTTYLIPSWNVSRLEKEIEKLNRRARKINCPELRLERLGETSRPAPGYEDRAETWGASECPHITLVEFAIHGQGPIIEGFKFLGTLDHTSLPGSVIVKTVPGETVPAHFYNASAECGHCGKIRRRNETFILQGDDGFVQVGRQCIRDFLGHNPEGVAAFLTRIIKFTEDLGENDEYWGSGSGPTNYTFDHITVLKVTSAIIRKHGWLARSAVKEEGQRATADDVMQYFMPPLGAEQRRQWEKWVDSLDINDEINQKEAEDARAWLTAQAEDDSRFKNEYMHNLHAINEAEEVPTRLFGYWCSLLAAYQRAMERLELAKRERKVSEHVGTVGKRQDFTVKVVSIKYTDGYYGTVSIVRMLDDEGRTIVWFASGEANMRRGEKYRIKATVKKHDEFNDWKQTIVNRAKVLENLEDESEN